MVRIKVKSKQGLFYFICNPTWRLHEKRFLWQGWKWCSLDSFQRAMGPVELAEATSAVKTCNTYADRSVCFLLF